MTKPYRDVLVGGPQNIFERGTPAAPVKVVVSLVAPATPAYAAGGAARPLTRFKYVIQIHRRHRVAVESHDGISQMLAFVRFDPRLN